MEHLIGNTVSILKEKINFTIDNGHSALKPANEPICLARKPLSEKSVAENVLKWRTGGINVDGCRVGTDDNIKDIKGHKSSGEVGKEFDSMRHQDWISNSEGRFPANIILECICDNREDSENHEDPNCPCRLLDEQSGTLKTGSGEIGKFNHNSINSGSKVGMKSKFVSCYADKGGASRYFYQAKVSKAERNMGLDAFDDKIIEGRDEGQDERNVAYKPRPVSQKNTHPTVKPINLMAYLCRLITPENGIVLDPFMGSGSTGIATQLEGFRFVGMEMDPDYFKIAEARISSYEKYNKFKK